jgi:outer membrane protein OmpA-like peptidoglycan-associated protein
MTTDAAKGRKTADNRQESRRLRPVSALAGALVVAAALAPLMASEAAAQSRSGITINNDVLNNLGPGPEAAPFAPLAPGAQPSYQAPSYQAPSYAAPSYQAPMAPPADGGSSLGFQPYGSGNFVVTRPGTLLFPPLDDPDSTLTPGFAGQPDNHAARARALDSAFAEGPEPSSQLLIPLDGPAAGGESGDSVIVFMDALPPADPDADTMSAPRLVLRQPPQPAPRKPAVPAETLADVQQRMPAEAPASLAPEFTAPEPTEVADLPPAEPEEPVTDEIAASEAIVDETPAPAFEAEIVETVEAETPATETAVTEAVVTEPVVAEVPMAEVPVAETPVAETPVAAASASMTPMAEAPASDTPDTAAPVSLLPAASDAAGRVQTASLTVGGFEDTSLLFDTDSADLSPEAQTELRSIADALRGSEGGDIQVLGFAAGSDGADDQARKLALSRALKVRSFLIDEGIASARIRVRSLGASAEGGPANRVDIRPIGS